METLNRIKGSSKDVRESYRKLKTENRAVSLNYHDYLKSIEINEWFGNSINFNDCTIITTMMDLGITGIVSFDSDFEKLGKYEVISKIQWC